MRVGYDITSLNLPRTGVGRYTLELLRALVALQPMNEYVLLEHRRPQPDAIVDAASVSRLRGPRAPWRLAWMQTLLPMELTAAHLDVCHFTNFQLPMFGYCPLVVTFHDLSILVNPELHPMRRVAVMRPFLRAMAHRAAAIITPSQSARADVVDLLGVDPARVHAVPEAAGPQFRRVLDEPELARVAKRYRLSPGFPLFVGTIEPRKNLLSLVEAYARLRLDGFTEPLVLCGQLGWKFGPLLERIHRPDLADSVRLLGYVPDGDLSAMFSLAGAFVYPSLHEGFGLPVLEALACGTPTITSDRGAMLEVAGDAAILVDPTDIEALAGALALGLSDAATRRRLADAGPRRAARYSWKATAQATAAVYRSVVAARA